MSLTTELKLSKYLNRMAKYYIGGIENGYSDGEYTEEEAEDYTSLESVKEGLHFELLKAYKQGYLQNPDSREVIEAKHIKFLGNEVINQVIEDAATKAKENAEYNFSEPKIITQNLSQEITITEIAKQLNIKPSQARTKLRNSIPKPQKGWKWNTKEEIEYITSLLKK